MIVFCILVQLRAKIVAKLIVVRATWDDEASVWIAESQDLPGLVTEAGTFDELNIKLPGVILDLLNGEDEIDVSMEIVASCSRRITRPRAAAGPVSSLH